MIHTVQAWGTIKTCSFIPVPNKYLPAIIRYHKLAKALLGLIILLGLAICFLALWLLIWAPNIRQRDNPHWSGVPVRPRFEKLRSHPNIFQVLLSGILGMVLVCCFRKEHPGMKKNFFVYSIKVSWCQISIGLLFNAFDRS
jgi:hypothetical protein